MNQPLHNNPHLNVNYLRIRKIIGILGLSLPWVLLLGSFIIDQLSQTQYKTQLPSISHYYYSSMNVMFTGFMVFFGIFLITYKGYKPESKTIFTDNSITTIGGTCAILTAFVPTGKRIWMMDAPNQHTNELAGYFHFGFAGLFLILMGIMCIRQFTKGLTHYPEKTEAYHKKKSRNLIYIICGYGVFLGIAFCIVAVVLKWNMNGPAVFYGEAFAVSSFGIAWLVKGETMKNSLLKRLF